MKSGVYQGSLHIENANWKDLAGLEKIESITGDLAIRDNPELVSLNGLQNVRKVGGQVRIELNPHLESLGALARLKSIGRSVLPVQADNLEPGFVGKLLAGRSALELKQLAEDENKNYMRKLIMAYADWGLVVRNNDSLQTLAGLDALETVGGSVVVERNTALTELGSLNALREVKGWVRIDNQTSLRGLGGLGALEYVGWEIRIIGQEKMDANELAALAARLKNSARPVEVLSQRPDEAVGKPGYGYPRISFD